MFTFFVTFLFLQIATALNTTVNENTPFEIPNERIIHSGKCVKGTVYKVLTNEDLKSRYSDQLECIYAAGLPPSKVPEGRLPLVTYSILNNHLVVPVMNELITAKFIFKVSCKKDQAVKTYYMGLNKTPGGLTFPLIASLMETKVHVVPGEHSEKLSFLGLDYSVDFHKLCDDRNPLHDIPNLHIPHVGNAFPISNIFDTLRLAGRDEDGSAILMGKAYFKLGISEGVYTTGAYFTVSSLDAELNPEFKTGDALPALKQGFSYKIPSLG